MEVLLLNEIDNMNIKLYSSSLVYKETINPKIVKNDISFASQINWWLGRLVLLLDLKIDDTTFEYWDIIKIEINSDVLYAWLVEEINKNATNFEQLEIVCNWYASLLSRLIYDETWNYEVTKNDLASNIIDDIVDFYNTKYNYLSKDIEATTWNVNYKTNYTDLLRFTRWINDLSENYFWYVDENWVFNFKEKPTLVKNRLTFEKDIFELKADEDSTQVVNQLIVERATATDVFNDAASQTTYWVRTKKITDKNILDLSSATDFANKYFEENASAKKKIKLIINNWFKFNSYLYVDEMELTIDEYTQTIDDLFEVKNIENIEPWESLKILNLNHDLWDNLLIAKKIYNPYRIILDLENYDNFIELIKE